MLSEPEEAEGGTMQTNEAGYAGEGEGVVSRVKHLEAD